MHLLGLWLATVWAGCVPSMGEYPRANGSDPSHCGNDTPEPQKGEDESTCPHDVRPATWAREFLADGWSPAGLSIADWNQAGYALAGNGERRAMLFAPAEVASTAGGITARDLSFDGPTATLALRGAAMGDDLLLLAGGQDFDAATVPALLRVLPGMGAPSAYALSVEPNDAGIGLVPVALLPAPDGPLAVFAARGGGKAGLVVALVVRSVVADSGLGVARAAGSLAQDEDLALVHAAARDGSAGEDALVVGDVRPGAGDAAGSVFVARVVLDSGNLSLPRPWKRLSFTDAEAAATSIFHGSDGQVYLLGRLSAGGVYVSRLTRPDHGQEWLRLEWTVTVAVTDAGAGELSPLGLPGRVDKGLVVAFTLGGEPGWLILDQDGEPYPASAVLARSGELDGPTTSLAHDGSMLVTGSRAGTMVGLLTDAGLAFASCGPETASLALAVERRNTGVLSDFSPMSASLQVTGGAGMPVGVGSVQMDADYRCSDQP
jgi:hypothetical protein